MSEPVHAQPAGYPPQPGLQVQQPGLQTHLPGPQFQQLEPQTPGQQTQQPAPGPTGVALIPGAQRSGDLQSEVRQWRASAALVAGCVLLGVLQALLWAAIAPGEQFEVYTDGSFLPLPTESTHQFTSIAMFALLGVVVGTSVAVAAWNYRSIRGTLTLLTVGLANGLGALTAYLLGRVWAGGVDPASIGPKSAASIVQAGPVLGSLIVIVAQPAIAVAIYTFAAAWNGTPDLDRSDRSAA